MEETFVENEGKNLTELCKIGDAKQKSNIIAKGE